MGLDVSHDCWSGGYSSFHYFRIILAKAAGFPPLELMRGFYSIGSIKETYTNSIAWNLPIEWDRLGHDVLCEILGHSDCGGEIEHKHCKPLADRMSELKDFDPGPQFGRFDKKWFHKKMEQWIGGLMFAHEQGEDVEFY
jgi:hypothetical protein